jgi:uncharacterized membrane protein
MLFPMFPLQNETLPTLARSFIAVQIRQMHMIFALAFGSMLIVNYLTATMTSSSAGGLIRRGLVFLMCAINVMAFSVYTLHW